MSFFGFDADLPNENDDFVKVQTKKSKKNQKYKSKNNHIESRFDQLNEDTFGDGDDSWQMGNEQALFADPAIQNMKISDPAVRSTSNGPPGFQESVIMNQPFQDPAIMNSGFQDPAILNNKSPPGFIDPAIKNSSNFDQKFVDPAIQGFTDPAIQGFTDPLIQESQQLPDFFQDNSIFQQEELEKKDKKAKKAKKEKKSKKKKSEKEQEEIARQKLEEQQKRDQEFKKQTETIKNIWGDDPEPEPVKKQVQTQPKGPPSANALGFKNNRNSSPMSLAMPNHDVGFVDPSIVAMTASPIDGPKMSSRPPPGLPPGFENSNVTPNRAKTLAEIEQEMMNGGSGGQMMQNGGNNAHRMQNGQMMGQNMRQNIGSNMGQSIGENNQQNPHHLTHSHNQQNFQQNRHAPAQIHQKRESPNYEMDFPSISEGLDPAHLAMMKNQQNHGQDMGQNMIHNMRSQTMGQPVGQNQQNMNRNNSLNNNRQNNNRQSSYRDKFANLMSHREKRFVVEIQMKQLRTTDPLNDDYYYQKYVERLHAKPEIKSDEKTGLSALQEANVEHPPDKTQVEKDKLLKEKLLEKENQEKLERQNSEKLDKLNAQKHTTIPDATMSSALEATIAALSSSANKKLKNKSKKDKIDEHSVENGEEKDISEEVKEISEEAENSGSETHENHQVVKKSKHSDALGRMVKSSHYNPRKMIEIGETEDADISFQKRMMPMRHLEDALMSVILLIQKPVKLRNLSQKSDEENIKKTLETQQKSTEMDRNSPDSASKSSKIDQNEVSSETQEPTEEEIQAEALEQLKTVLGFNNPDGTESINKEDTVIKQWSVVLRWRKGRTLVQRSILALARFSEFENATIALRFICRCMRHLIMSENLEKEQLPKEQQKFYKSTLDQNFMELLVGINALPATASFESLLELLGVAEDESEKCLIKFDQIGMNLDEVLHNQFTLSLFVVLFERLFEESMLKEGSDEEKEKKGQNFRLILEYLRSAVLKERPTANDLPQPLTKINQLPELLRLVGINASFK